MTAAAIPPAIAPRVGALLRLLGSDVDGEALGAARALRRTLGGVGLDLHALADAVERPAVMVMEREAPTPRARRTRKSRQPNPDSVELRPTGRRHVVDVLGRARARGALSAWEGEFCASIIVTLQGSRPRLSVRQFEVVERLMSRFGEGSAWA